MIDIKIIILTIMLVELLSIIIRFLFKISAMEINIKIMRKLKLKRFYHFHHLFSGILIAVIFYSFYPNALLFNIGLGIAASDIVHHFIVLWIIMGNPEFHIVYKNVKELQKEERTEQRKIRKFVKVVEKEERTEERKIRTFVKNIGIGEKIEGRKIGKIFKHLIHEVEDIEKYPKKIMKKR
jgi:hypothetical protein